MTPYEQGYQVGYSGQTVDNPFPKNSDDWDEWQTGVEEGDADYDSENVEDDDEWDDDYLDDDEEDDGWDDEDDDDEYDNVER